MGQNLLGGPDSTSGFGGAVFDSSPCCMLQVLQYLSLQERDIAAIAADAVLVFAALAAEFLQQFISLCY
jgi:hypothetical protein